MELFTVNRLRSLLLLIFVSTAFLLAGFIYKNYEKFPDSISVSISKGGVDIGIKNFRLVEEEGGTKKWRLEAEEAEVIKSKDITRLKGVRVTFFQPDAEDVRLTADAGVIMNTTKEMKAVGNVMIRNGDMTLESDMLNCRSNAKVVTTDRLVKIKGRNFEVTGTGMVSDLNKERIEILKNVQMVIYPEKKG